MLYRTGLSFLVDMNPLVSLKTNAQHYFFLNRVEFGYPIHRKCHPFAAASAITISQWSFLPLHVDVC